MRRVPSREDVTRKRLRSETPRKGREREEKTVREGMQAGGNDK